MSEGKTIPRELIEWAERMRVHKYGFVVKFSNIADEGDPNWNDFRYEKEKERFRLRFDTKTDQVVIYLSRHSLLQLYQGVKQLLKEASER